MTGTNRYYEDIVFENGSRIKLSHKVDTNYYNTIHWHPYFEVLVSTCEGNEVTIDFTRSRLDENDIAIVYPGDLHAVHYVTETSFIIIQFPPSLLAVMGELNSILPLLSGFNCLKYDPEDPDSVRVKQITDAIGSLYSSDDSFREVLIYSELLKLFAEVGRKLNGSSPKNADSETSTDRANLKLMNEACLYISENCMKPLTLNETAAAVGVSRSHFAHLFKEYTDMTFVDYLTRERIRLAESFFLNPQLRITDIAFESGFTSISSFNRAFRKIKGCSPSEFRSTMID